LLGPFQNRYGRFNTFNECESYFGLCYIALILFNIIYVKFQKTVDRHPLSLLQSSGRNPIIKVEKEFMLISKKNQYALRAIYELAKQSGNGPVKINHIAETQAIPERFLEVILGQLKKSGFVESKRGYQGGYVLVPPPDQLTVGALMRYLQKDVDVSKSMAPIQNSKCPFQGNCAFFPMWKRVKDAMFQVYDDTTIQDLLDSGIATDKYPLS
jgi:Rrf2 family protein